MGSINGHPTTRFLARLFLVQASFVGDIMVVMKQSRRKPFSNDSAGPTEAIISELSDVGFRV